MRLTKEKILLQKKFTEQMSVYWALDYIINFEEKDNRERKLKSGIKKRNGKAKTIKPAAKITPSTEKKKKK